MHVLATWNDSRNVLFISDIRFLFNIFSSYLINLMITGIRMKFLSALSPNYEHFAEILITAERGWKLVRACGDNFCSQFMRHLGSS